MQSQTVTCQVTIVRCGINSRARQDISRRVTAVMPNKVSGSAAETPEWRPTICNCRCALPCIATVTCTCLAAQGRQNHIS